MKCSSCGGSLSGNLTTCPYCGTRQNIDFKHINTRNLGPVESMPCPRCEGGAINKFQLGVTATPEEAELEIAQCQHCYGIFFDPGELEQFLESSVSSTVWNDNAKITQLNGENREIREPQRGTSFYRRCPACNEFMNEIGFGGSSGVKIDQCQRHGVWLDGGELHRITEWWHAGGKHKHQARELSKAQWSERQQRRPIPKLTLTDGTGELSSKDSMTAWSLIQMFESLCSWVSDPD